LKLWSDIAATALSIRESVKGWADATGARSHGKTKVIPLHLTACSALSLIAFLVMTASGLAPSLTLPAAAAIFAGALTLCLAWRELWPPKAPVLPAMQAPAATGMDMLDLVPGLFSRHDAAGQMIAVSGADRKAFGFPSARVEASSYIDAVHVGGRIAFLSAVDALRQGADRAEAEFLFASSMSEASYRPVRAVCIAEPRTNGEFAGFVVHTTDISGMTALRDEAVAWKSEARSANDAKTRFLAAVSHELRTPLNAILGFSDILIGEYFGAFQNDRQKEYVTLINQSGHHLLAVVNTMLDMSKIEAGRYELIKEPFQVAAAVRAVDEMLALQAKSKGVVLTTRVARGMGEVIADRRAMQQVLINLANNAIKFTAEGGVVAIDAVCDQRNLVITVSDTGIGIPADKLALIGLPFMQVQSDYARRYEGTGLGLALVKGLVALHGGTFAIESEEGVGTVVTVTVPMDGEGDAGTETFEFPPRLKEKTIEKPTGENRHGAAEAKIA
jgi:cell cycle sensor histidine kinase DivJ